MSRSYLFPDHSFIPSVICTLCGENAHCIRRQGKGAAEIRTFVCKCGNQEVRVLGDAPTDAKIQREIESRVQGSKI
jgi:hypothetical protein